MKINVFYLLCFLSLAGFSQTVQSPSEFLGYELGTEFTRHHQVVDYYEYLASVVPDRVKLEEYGKTNERRPLLLAFVSSAANISNLESIRKTHLESTAGGRSASKAIVWLSYNVHGNESVSTEASMQTIYALLTEKKEYLENTVVIIDPCINPDGRDRYVNWYNSFKNTPHQVNPDSKEHHEGWLSGRANHYMFDLNRDWAWLTQVESRQRLVKYNQWLPHIHVDFHEQGVDSPYFFAPSAEPFHEVITPFQRSFQATLGRNHAKYFDANGWFYFTKERFDLFYPSYGDTYPTYNGAIGMTYEQGGSGRAGLGVITGIGDTLTLKDRIAHHFTTGLSTVEVASQNHSSLNEEFRKFYQNRDYQYKSYVLNGNSDHKKALTRLLDQHGIQYGWGTNGQAKGFVYGTGRNGSVPTNSESLVISTDQTKGTLVKVLFEPDAKLSDSLTYDITAWSLPYAYGLDALASTSPVSSSFGAKTGTVPVPAKDSYAYVADWNSMEDARFLADLLKAGIRVRTSHTPFSLNGKSLERGSLIITKADNADTGKMIRLFEIFGKYPEKEITAVSTGFVDRGRDFGSNDVKMIVPVKVGVLSGEPTSTLRFGEIWHFFEQQLHYPLTVLDAENFGRVELEEYDVLVFPDGWGYRSFLSEANLGKVSDWVKGGGRLIAMGSAIGALKGKDGFGIKEQKDENGKGDESPEPDIYEEAQRERMKDEITGAIFKAKVDPTHPLAFGYGDTYFSLKLGNDSYEYLDGGTVAYLEGTARPVAGFAGSEAQKKIANSLLFGVENSGRGQVVYMVDNPLFRGFWENGKLFFVNALFMLD
ncbi:Zinc carboxypeptidase [Muriicola jejuensis]|uniref:Zinc carboxypeptidase n=1 Tax=Muriicola jejuensis TaxID=504488 RepID=A0A6P0U8W0_9FLAO|nr:M14 family metallopeptidase [Muriicola jejuensis]NER09010.1 zinc carboxypeptidase [Muriicola jejuensis]SMP12193.1 Zinc carboxypeptidase [Muriicola jejuensis]